MPVHRFSLHSLIVPALLAATMAWAAGQSLTVQVQEAQLRQGASFTSPPVAKLPYGAQVSVLEQKGDWYSVQSGTTTGWMHNSAFAAARPAQMTAGKSVTPANVSEREVSMAGKGFGQETARAYASAHPEGYAAVEAMLRVSFAPGELEAFLAAGQAGKGGAQ